MSFPSARLVRGFPEEPQQEGSSTRATACEAAPVPFRVGEKLTFSVEYGPVTAGEAVMSIASIDTIMGFPSYHIISTARTNEIFSAMYKVDDNVESHMDITGLFSRHFKKRLREGSFKRDHEVYFDQEKMVARYTNGDSLSTLAETQDILSAFFYLRAQDLSVGKKFSFPCHDNKKNYPLVVKVLRKEKVVVPAGKFRCYVLEPKLKTGGLMKKKAKMLIWVTEDDRKMPVLMETRVTIGSIAAKLVEYDSGIDNAH